MQSSEQSFALDGVGLCSTIRHTMPHDPSSDCPEPSSKNIKPWEGNPPGEENLNIIYQTVKSGKELSDLVLDNPQFVPWSVVIPYTVEGGKKQKYSLVFVRAANASNAMNVALAWWDGVIRRRWSPKWYPADADYQGKVHATRLDEGDYQEYFYTLWRKARTDFDKWPMNLCGSATVHCTAFHAPWFDEEPHDFSHLKDTWQDRRIITGDFRDLGDIRA